MDHGRVAGLKHYLLGSTNDRLEAMEAVLVAAHPGVVIAGMASPPFRELTEEERIVQARNIRASGADIVWVGLGTPKQDIEAERLAIELGIPAVAVGAAFDFTAGAVREAPRWCRAIGLEWAYRLWREPRRLWRRYLIGNPQFVVSVVRGYLQSVGS
jgi:N-acetylglucosaminyldiphosphoundecaprenol N-acetyl-beta-D-mannosaminyltransferase